MTKERSALRCLSLVADLSRLAPEYDDIIALSDAFLGEQQLARYRAAISLCDRWWIPLA
jgi:hypothetical protein